METEIRPATPQRNLTAIQQAELIVNACGTLLLKSADGLTIEQAMRLGGAARCAANKLSNVLHEFDR